MRRLFVLLVGAAMLQVISGCGPAAKPGPASKGTAAPKDSAQEHGHDHPDHGAGPHGGTLVDWGGGAYHVEFTVDHDKKETMVYLLGSDEKSPAPIKAEKIHLVIDDPMTELDLTAQPLEGEAKGMSSRFVGTHDTLGIVREFSGTISGEIEGTPYTKDFKEVPHGADHKH